MKYDLSNEVDVKKYDKRIEVLKIKGAFVELIDKSNRSKSQNSYLHVLLTALALELGYSLRLVKVQVYKMECNKDMFLIEKKGKLGVKKDIRSSADLTKDEMTTSIERLKKWSAEHGIYLPDVDEKQALRAIEKDYERYKHLVE